MRKESHTCYDRLAELLGARRPAAHHAQLEHGRDIARHDARLLHGGLHCEIHLCSQSLLLCSCGSVLLRVAGGMRRSAAETSIQLALRLVNRECSGTVADRLSTRLEGCGICSLCSRRANRFSRGHLAKRVLHIRDLHVHQREDTRDGDSTGGDRAGAQPHIAQRRQRGVAKAAQPRVPWRTPSAVGADAKPRGGICLKRGRRHLWPAFLGTRHEQLVADRDFAGAHRCCERRIDARAYRVPACVESRQHVLNDQASGVTLLWRTIGQLELKRSCPAAVNSIACGLAIWLRWPRRPRLGKRTDAAHDEAHRHSSWRVALKHAAQNWALRSAGFASEHARATCAECNRVAPVVLTLVTQPQLVQHAFDAQSSARRKQRREGALVACKLPYNEAASEWQL